MFEVWINSIGRAMVQHSRSVTQLEVVNYDSKPRSGLCYVRCVSIVLSFVVFRLFCDVNFVACIFIGEICFICEVWLHLEHMKFVLHRR
ncbi:hypothetical protein RHGRI_010136 [Rhododendron griersonianum]|uniref:Uncharacterized protein n=1 Tax=Rhododendron griersonianum TaxID=479676 RepID=A0AAV6KHZ3_9ERIC|nr:hypothetical protein RHGRI_010136 [Rhododendron griersonianum]